MPTGVQSALLVLSGIVLTASGVSAAVFVPPDFPVGSVMSNDNNDGYYQGRGIVFTASADTTISSAGTYQHLTNVDLTFSILETSGTTGAPAILNTLYSATQNVTVGSLQWVDFSFAPITLQAGHNYALDFSFSDASVENFYYWDGNQPFTVGNFTNIDGYLAMNTANYVMPAIRTDAVPEPTSLAILGLAAGGLLARRRRA